MSDLQIITDTLFEPDDIVEIRCLRKLDKGNDTEHYWASAKDLSSLADELAELNRQGFNIYYGVNPRKDFNFSGDRNVLLARCLFCDFDHLEPGDGCGRLEFVWNDIFFAGLPEPTLAVHSGHGLHVYWRLAEPILDLNVWKDTQNKLNARLGADKTIKNPERIMRLPGYLNTKKEPYQECFVCWSPFDAHK
ncbi:MAG TPA: DNA-primase RepB domain-containing protein [Anaerohalosphaeraceae bacterium]|nr:DNA-primase RepB domain-containing protein [Anaerohalosphaeraceae bacterium]